MKKIILFTRLSGNEEWNAWKNWQSQNASTFTFEDDREIKKKSGSGDIEMVIRNGNQILGDIPPYPGGNVANAKEFVDKLHSQIHSETDPETVIAIHFGGAVTYEERLEKWLTYLRVQDNNASIILSSFNNEHQPKLTHYSIVHDEEPFVRDKLANLEAFYRELRGEPGDPLLEAKLELLHMLLVPPEKLETTEQDNREWRKHLKLRAEDAVGEDHVTHWSDFKHGFQAHYRSEPFNGDYLTLLSALRDALLPEHNYAQR